MFEVTHASTGTYPFDGFPYNLLEQLTFGGRLSGGDLVYKGKRNGVYQSTPYVAWAIHRVLLCRNHHFQVTLNTAQSSFEEWEEVAGTDREVSRVGKKPEADA